MLWLARRGIVSGRAAIDTSVPVVPVGKALIYSGTGSAQSITGAGFSPDLVAIKARDATTGWRWTDDVRGVTLSVDSSAQSAEATEAGGITAFDADGFSIGTDADYNANGVNFLALCFQIVPNAFDIVTYAGTGSAHTVAHGLGVTPELIIIKNRTTGSTNWAVYPGPESSPGTKFLQFQTTAAVGLASTVWNNTDATSSVFTVGTSSAVNTNTNNYIAWLFASKAGVCKIGSYTGDGASPGPFITTNFLPKFVIVKATSTTGNWRVFDSARDASNPSGTYNSSNSTAVESTVTGGADFQATGFQFTDAAAAAVNDNGTVYMYLAVA